jgi:hypothetical protein
MLCTEIIAFGQFLKRFDGLRVSIFIWMQSDGALSIIRGKVGLGQVTPMRSEGLELQQRHDNIGIRDKDCVKQLKVIARCVTIVLFRRHVRHCLLFCQLIDRRPIQSIIKGGEKAGVGRPVLKDVGRGGPLLEFLFAEEETGLFEDGVLFSGHFGAFLFLVFLALFLLLLSILLGTSRTPLGQHAMLEKAPYYGLYFTFHTCPRSQRNSMFSL